MARRSKVQRGPVAAALSRSVHLLLVHICRLKQPAPTTPALKTLYKERARFRRQLGLERERDRRLTNLLSYLSAIQWCVFQQPTFTMDANPDQFAWQLL